MLIVAGDAHIGSGQSLGRSPSGPESRLADQQRSWESLCRIAVEQGADVVGTGDFLHHRKPSASEIDAFQAGLRILRDGGRAFLSVAGNHEVTDRDAPSCLEAACAGFDAIVFRGPQVLETEDGVIGFLPWSPFSDARAQSAALMVVAEQLAADGARILIAHWALSAASLPTGLPVLELAEPILDSHALASMFDVVLAGHIHKRQVIVEAPLVAHAGPLCRGNFGEAGITTGAVDIRRSALPTRLAPSLRSQNVTWFPVDDRQMVAIECDVTEAGHYAIDQILDEISDAPIGDAIVRVSYQQRADQQIDQAVVLACCMEYGAWKVDRLEPIIERVESVRSAGISEASDPREAWDRWQDAQDGIASEETLAAVRAEAHSRIGAA